MCAIGPKLEKIPDADPNGVVVVRHGVLVCVKALAIIGGRARNHRAD
jgi:hypothetical protein